MMTDTLLTTPPEYWLVKVDERRYWVDEIQAQTKEIRGVYAFDRNSVAHLCELTPSYCLMFVGMDYEEIDDLTEEQRESLNVKILDGQLSSEPLTYMHVRTVEGLAKKFPNLVKKVEMDFDLDENLTENEKWNATFDQLVEGWHTGALTF